MSLEAHFEMLSLKHHNLDALLQEEASRPLPDFTAIQRLKKQKLLLKEELERMNITQRRQGASSA